MALGVVGMSPAEAAHLTKFDSSGSVAFDVDVSPFVSSFLPPDLQALLDPQQVDFDSTIIVDNAHGRLSDTEDEELTVGLSHVEDYLEELLPSVFLPLIDDINFQGSVLDSQNNLLSEFDVFYRDNEIVAGNYEYTNIKSCLESTCSVLFNGNASASLFSSSDINLIISGGLTQTAMSLGDDDSVEPGLVSFDYSIAPIDSVPEPIALLPVDSEPEPEPPVAENPSEPEPEPPVAENPSEPEPPVAENPSEPEPEPPVAEEPSSPTDPSEEFGDESDIASVPEPTTLLGLFGLGGFFAAKRKRMKAD
jgi:hypothetical protein